MSFGPPFCYSEGRHPRISVIGAAQREFTPSPGSIRFDSNSCTKLYSEMMFFAKIIYQCDRPHVASRKKYISSSNETNIFSFDYSPRLQNPFSALPLPNIVEDEVFHTCNSTISINNVSKVM